MTSRTNNSDRLSTRFTIAGLLGGLTCVAGLIGIACSNGTHDTPTAENRSTHPTADTHGLHAVRNADLRMIMNKLHAMHLTEITDEIEITGELHRDICDVGTMAESLAADAQLIPILLDNSTMTDEARRLMTSMSTRLKLEAEEVVHAANREDLPALRNNLRNMLDTCTACHHEFRAPTLAMADKPARWQGL
ncbi:MAG: cytochrome c [Phycisphaerales bacterium]|nr:cytochrome c [Phycisphaerales bacterium]MCB9857258.1 cytochrome c [Phycisphaerales bacterium]MCB9863028.1 cytochrome c [Phycisphaerales bacterium]